MMASWWWLYVLTAVSSLISFNEAQTVKSCPPQELILPCRCLVRGDETQIWCSHSDLQRVLGGLRAVGQYIFYPIDELILENNNLPSLPGRSFIPLQVMRLMLRYNGLERVSNGWLNGLESSLMELYIVEPDLRSLPDESLERMENLEAVTIQSKLLKHLPNFSALPKLRYLQIESFSITDLSPRQFKALPQLEKFQLSGSPKLTRLEVGLLQDLPSLVFVNISFCGVMYVHPRAIARLPSLTDLSLIGNRITDAGMIGRGVRDLPRLENLNLDFNEIDKLDEAAFVDLPSLKRLSMSNNQIMEIHRGAFHRVPQLKVLDLNNNLVRRVHPESFLLYSNTGLEELWLMNNEISHVAELRAILDALPRLVFLELSNNNIEAIPFAALRGHPTLERLHLDHNNIHLIDRDAFMAMPALRELRLKNNSLTDISEGPFWNLPALKGLDLSYNYFKRIEPRLLENIPSLRQINLRGNDLRMIDPATFLVTPSLEHINLSRNSLTTLHPATFRHLLNLFELDISFNKLIEFVPGLPRGIEYLHMSHNQISNFPMAPSPDLDLPSLRLLDMSHNLLQKIPGGSMRTLPQLRKLFIGGNLIQQLDNKVFQGLKHLEVLDLQFNKIVQLSQLALYDLYDLQELNIKENRLEVLRPEVFESVKRIKKLDISKNQLTEILPGTVENFKEIEELDISDNLLLQLPSGIYGMKNLRILNLVNNRLKQISADVLSSLTSLKELRLSKNDIKELKTGSFHKLLELELLHLDNNLIEEIESFSIHSLPLLKSVLLNSNKIHNIGTSVFSNLPLLEVLELQDNIIRKIASNAFESVPHLLVLNLSSNHISNLDDIGLNSVPSLEMLDLSNNKLTRVSSTNFEKMEWLVELRLDDNSICAVHGFTFNGMPRLRVLSLKNNKMMSFPEVAVQKLRGNLAVFDLDGNPLMCSCNMLWLKGWLQEASLIGPRCVDGSFVREIRLTREECLYEINHVEQVAPGCEAELLSAPSHNHGTPQNSNYWMNLRTNSTKNSLDAKNNLQPSPEESEYFYDEYVDYPINVTTIADTTKQQSNSLFNKPLYSSTQKPKVQSYHHISGDTPTIYAGPTKNKTKSQPPKEVSGSPSSSGFTFFGVPLPSLSFNNLWSGNSRMAEKKPVVSSLLGQTPMAQRKTAIVNKPNKDFSHTIMLPPSIPDIQKGGFVPLLQGEGGFKPMIAPHGYHQKHNFTVDVDKVNVKQDSVSEEAVNPTPTRLPISTNSYILKDDKFTNMGHPIPIPTQPIIKNQEKRSTTTPKPIREIHSPLQNIEIMSNFSKEVNSTIKKEIPKTANKHVVEITSSAPKITTTKTTTTSTTIKPKNTQNYSNLGLEIASDAKSFDEIFKDVVENVSIPAAITEMKPSTTSTLAPPKIQLPPSINKTERVLKNEGTPLSTLLIPGGIQPQHRPAKIKSSITKVQSPHVSSSSPLKADYGITSEANVFSDNDNFESELASDITPLPQSREGKNTYVNNQLKEEKKQDEDNWYFSNYNNTNIEPYIGPGKMFNNSSNIKEFSEILIFVCILIANIF